jgi:Bacterial HORMA domain family 1
VSSYSYAETFSRTHARRLAGRVTTDLRQSHILYGSPTESRLEQYRLELEELLSGGYVDRYQFGFKRDETAVWSLRYVVGPDGSLTGTGTAGGVPVGQNVTGATFFNILTFSDSWSWLSLAGRKAVEQELPFIRTDGTLPGEVGGYWTCDRTYAAGGVALERSVFRRLAA